MQDKSIQGIPLCVSGTLHSIILALVVIYSYLSLKFPFGVIQF